jgi:hypothetical protein
MIGTTALFMSLGCPWAGGPTRRFERSDVRAFGKLVRYNDSVTRYLVRLVDGAELFVKGTEQGEADLKWLRKLGKQLSVTMSVTTARDVGYAVGWKDVAP